MPRKEPRTHKRKSAPGRSVRETATRDRQKRSNVNRDTEVRRLYDRKWNLESKAWRAQYPACALCFEKGILTAPQCVDHWIPHRGDEGLFWDTSNWVPLCFVCHNGAKTRLEIAWDNGAKRRDAPQLATLDMVTRFIADGSDGS